MKKGVKNNTAMNKLELNLTMEEPGWEDALPGLQKLSQEIMDKTISYVSAHEDIDFLQSGKTICVNLALSNDEEIHDLNVKFRQIDKPTNVLSFANIDDEDFASEINDSDVIELGDIIIALQTMQKEADEKGISLRNHFCHLFAHGLLHLLGFDHIEDDEAEYMEDFEVQILKTMNIANPYQE